MPTSANPHIAACLALTRAISRTRTVDEICAIGLDALEDGLARSRGAILLTDGDGAMRIKAACGLSDACRCGVEGVQPWSADVLDPQPIVVPDTGHPEQPGAWLDALLADRIAAVALVPLTTTRGVIGAFLLCMGETCPLTADQLQLAAVMASQVAFAVERMRAEEQARRDEERLRFALDSAAMGTWEWNVDGQSVRWSENLERVHGLPPGTFDGTFSSYEREIHPDDRERVLGSIRRALGEGVPHDVEYRIVAPDSTVRWVEGKGRVEHENGRPVRMSGVCMNVTRRKEADLARLSAVEETSRLKDEFLATLSHELRTPLNAIMGWVQLLQAGGLGPERLQRAIDVIGRNARLQAQLIEDILDVSRIITQKLELERRSVRVSSLVDAVLTGASPAADAKRITVTKEVPADLPAIDGDPRRLHQVLSNVVSNAVKFTPDGGLIEISCAVRGETVTIDVRDTGIGIEPDFLPFVFERFRQADCRSTRTQGGLGLGLAIASHLVEQHGGRIAAHSDGPGTGTTVTIELSAVPDAAEPAQQDAGAGGPDDAPRLDGLTVVVADDHRDSRELLAVLLEQCGAQVVACDGADAALEVLAQSPVQLLVADIAMPGLDGYELLRRARQLQVGVPAVAVSAYARPEDRSRALSSGYGAYCAKPIDGPAMLRTVRDVLAS